MLGLVFRIKRHVIEKNYPLQATKYGFFAKILLLDDLLETKIMVKHE